MLKKQSIYGKHISPSFGGGTSNVEFEALTGYSNYFLPVGSVPYHQYIKGPIKSMVSYLNDFDYKSIAIHPYEKWFWDRDKVYKFMGFNNFVSQEDFINPEVKGFFISDMEVSKEVIRQYETNNKKHLFIFAVTMQNHGTYEDERYGKIDLVDGNIDAKSKMILNTYTKGIKDADEALGYIIDYFKKVDKPTIIVMFGDHGPVLGNDFYVYKELGFLLKMAHLGKNTK